MSEIGVLTFCAAAGFVAAGTISSFYRLVTSERASFSISGASAPGVVLVVLLTMFAGPFMLVDRVIAGLRSRQISALPAMVGTVLAAMWSVCAGIFYLSLLLGV